MLYTLAAMVIYMFILHMNNIGRETFTSNLNKKSFKIPLMLIIIFILCYLNN